MFRRSLTVSCVLPLVMALGACGDTLGPDLPKDGPLAVSLHTDRASYASNDPASVTMVNHSSETLMFWGCSDALERQEGGRWKVAVDVDTNAICPAIGILLPPNTPVTFPFALHRVTKPGVYRLRRAFWPDNGPVTERSHGRSNTFRVQ